VNLELENLPKSCCRKNPQVTKNEKFCANTVAQGTKNLATTRYALKYNEKDIAPVVSQGSNISDHDVQPNNFDTFLSIELGFMDTYIFSFASVDCFHFSPIIR